MEMLSHKKTKKKLLFLFKIHWHEVVPISSRAVFASVLFWLVHLLCCGKRIVLMLHLYMTFIECSHGCNGVTGKEVRPEDLKSCAFY